jgi:hypothetical protein
MNSAELRENSGAKREATSAFLTKVGTFHRARANMFEASIRYVIEIIRLGGDAEDIVEAMKFAAKESGRDWHSVKAAVLGVATSHKRWADVQQALNRAGFFTALMERN